MTLPSGRCLYVVAAESSGDVFAAELVDELRARDPSLRFHGIGGAALAARGIVSPFDISPLSVLGLLEGLRAYRDVVRLADAACADILRAAPDTVLLVDSWGFMVRLAERVRAAAPHIRLIKVIGPQVWAMRPGRARSLARTVDEVLCIHPFELPFYEGLPIRASVIGNPALGRRTDGDGAAFRTRHGIPEGTPLVLILPGSRRAELRRTAPALIGAAGLIAAQRPDVRFVIAPGAGMSRHLPDDLAARLPGLNILPEDTPEKFDAMAAADLALACSGTVTTEVAMQDTPVLVAYRLGWITWAIARAFLFKARYINLLNVAAGREIVPEFVQTRCRADLIAEAALARLRDPALASRQTADQRAALDIMGANDAPAAARAAEAILR